MAEQKAAMSTWRFKLSVTHLSTGMWEEPRVRLRLRLLPTVTVIASGSLLRGILISTLRTGPGVIFFPKILICYRGDEEDGVFSPLLNTWDVEDTITTNTAPYRLRSLHRGDADETGNGSGLECLIQVLTSSLQV